MLQAKQLFDEGIARVRNLDSIYSHLITHLGLNPIDVSDLLRSEIVYSISCFDRLIHDLVRSGMVESFIGRRPPTNSYNNFGISIQQFNSINLASVPPAEIVFEQMISSKHSHLAFQEPDKVAEALGLIWNETHKWQKIATNMAGNEKDIKIELKNIVIRRNQIVHESDFDLFTRALQPISYSDTKQSVDFIDRLGNTIYSLVKI